MGYASARNYQPATAIAAANSNLTPHVRAQTIGARSGFPSAAQNAGQDSRAVADPTFSRSKSPNHTTMEVARRTVVLAKRAHRGDPAALNQLLCELRPVIVRTVRLIVGSGSWAAEDAAQDALFDISRGIGNLRAPEAVEIWCLRIATRHAVRTARKERLRRLRISPLPAELLQEAPREGRAAALKEAFDRLPPRLRATAVLRLQAGLTEDETADVLRCSVGTVKSNLHDARNRLARMLTEAGYTPTVGPQEAR